MDPMINARNLMYRHVIQPSSDNVQELEALSQAEHHALIDLWYTYTMVRKALNDTTDDQKESAQKRVELKAHDATAADVLQRWLRSGDILQFGRDIQNMNRVAYHAFKELCKKAQFLFQPYENTANGRQARTTLSVTLRNLPLEMEALLEKFWIIMSTMPEPESLHETTQNDNQNFVMLAARNFFYETVFPTVRWSAEKEKLIENLSKEEEKAITIFCYTYITVFKALSDTNLPNSSGSDYVLRKMMEKYRNEKQLVDDERARNVLQKWLRSGDAKELVRDVEKMDMAKFQAFDELCKTAHFLFEPLEDSHNGRLAAMTLVEPPFGLIPRMEAILQKLWVVIALFVHKQHPSNVTLRTSDKRKSASANARTLNVAPSDDVQKKAKSGQVEVEDPNLVATAFLNQWAQMERETPGLLPDFETLTPEQLDAVRKMCYESPALSDASIDATDSPGTSQN